MTLPVRQVAVAGAGIAGLMSALALQRLGVVVTVFERDPPPPANVAPADSMAWLRPGVAQSRHPHFFMGRLRALLEARYPELVDRLFRAGAGENAFADYLHPLAMARYRPRASDRNLRSLNLRRTTFEMVVRDYVAEQPGICIRDDVEVSGLSTDDTVPTRVIGVELGARAEVFAADAVIDASGRFSRLAEALAAAGIRFDCDRRDSGLCYLTRHYRLLPGRTFPNTYGLPGAAFDDFVVGALPADNGAFTVTFQIYREDRAVLRALREPQHFQSMCASVGVLAPWVDPGRAAPTSDVHGFGHMDSFWRRSVLATGPEVLGFFCVGDSAVRSNPKFGRGCTWATVAAHELAGLLASPCAETDRARAYERMLETEFRADWLTMRAIDRRTEAVFAVATGRRGASPLERASKCLGAWVGEALLTEPALFREVWAGYHGLQSMTAWMRRPASWLAIVRSRLERRHHRALVLAQQRRPDRQTLSATPSIGAGAVPAGS